MSDERRPHIPLLNGQKRLPQEREYYDQMGKEIDSEVLVFALLAQDHVQNEAREKRAV